MFELQYICNCTTIALTLHHNLSQTVAHKNINAGTAHGLLVKQCAGQGVEGRNASVV